MAKRKCNQDYFNLQPILNEKSIYNITIGEHSKGKTYALLLYTARFSAKNNKEVENV